MKTSLSLLAILTTLTALPSSALAESWPVWRGDIEGSGKTAETNLPLTWGPEKNVRWRVALPERGNSTPVIDQGRVFVTQAVDADKFRGLYCYDRESGALLWKTGLTYDKDERSHRDNPYCSASPATDGKHVFAAYGSAGVACYTLEGKQVWHRDLGAIDHEWGNSSSPVLHGKLCFIYQGPGKGAHLVALDKESGETVWRYDEPEWKPGERTDGFRGRSDGEGIIGSFSTPILIVAKNGREELVMTFPTEVRAFDPATGKSLWHCGGLNPLVYTSPVYADGIIIAMGGYQGNSLAVRTGGDGDVTDTHRLWHKERHNGGIGSGVAKDGHFYYHDSGGIVTCLEIESGDTKWEERLPGKGKSWGSFVLSGHTIYSLSQPGDSALIKANPEKFEPIGEVSDLKEHTNASIAVSEGELFIRTYDALWCIGSAKAAVR